jgi:hypothetical protein
MKKVTLVFNVVLFGWLAQTSLFAQIKVEQAAIDIFAKVSKQIEGDQQGGAKELVFKGWKEIPDDLKSDPGVLYAYALIRLANNLDSYNYLNRLSILRPDDYQIKKTLIYSAFKDKGGSFACGLINKYLNLNLEKVNPGPELKEFLVWATVVIESISVEDPIRKRLRTLIESNAYAAFKQANAKELKGLFEAADLELKGLNFNTAKDLDTQIIQAKQLLKKHADQFLMQRTNLTQTLYIAKRRVYHPVLDLDSSTIGRSSFTPDLLTGFHPDLDNLQRTGRQYVLNVAPHLRLFLRDATGQPINMSFRFKDRFGKIERINPSELYLTTILSYQKSVVPLTQLIESVILLQNRIQSLDLKMVGFLSVFSTSFKDAIKADAELRLAVSTWRQRLSQFNAQFIKLAKLEARQQALENRTLQLLGISLLPRLQFSPKEELVKLGIN